MNEHHLNDTVIKARQADRAARSRELTAEEKAREARRLAAVQWTARHLPDLNLRGERPDPNGHPCGWAVWGALNGRAKGISDTPALVAEARRFHDLRCLFPDMHAGAQLEAVAS